ncbi:MAG: sulfite reductase subunit A, partial [Jatrophihabitantaceae bacterium]
MASVIDPEALETLVSVLGRRGFRVLGPTVRDGAVVYADLESAADLPIGWKDVQEPGSYRLERRDDDARFGYAVGPHSWKQFLFPPRLRLWAASRTENGFEVTPDPPPDRPLALIGVRACELH